MTRADWPRWTTLCLNGLYLSACLNTASCAQSGRDNPNVILASVTTGPNNLDPRIGVDDVSQKIGQLIFNNLMDLDERLNVVPTVAVSLENPEPTVYVARLRQGLRFHDGHELTSADVVHTFRSFIDPAFISTRKAAFRGLEAVDAIDRYTVRFLLAEPFASFPNSLIIPVVPETADSEFWRHPVGTGPYRFERYLVDDRVDLTAFDDYFWGRPSNDGVTFRIIPDEIMRGLELRAGSLDIVINDVGPDLVHRLRDDDALTFLSGPGTDYQYMAMNLRDPVLHDVRVRQALAYAIDRNAIVDYLRRGFAEVAAGPLPSLSWAFAPVTMFDYDPARARALLDEAGYADPDGDGPQPRLHLSLKVSNIEFNRLQSTVIQQDLARVGIALDVRTYEFATLIDDILSGNFQMYTLQWVGAALADPDILRQMFHSSQMPPRGFNRGFFSHPRVDALLDEASTTFDSNRRRQLYAEVQTIIAEQVPYISLWTKTNYAIASRTLTGVSLSPFADFFFFKDVARRTPASP